MTDLNLLSLINNVTKDTANVAQKAYMDKSMDKTADASNSFNNVFESANKTYSSETFNSQKKSAVTSPSTSNRDDFNKVSANKVSDKKQTENTKDFNDSQNKISSNDANRHKPDEVNTTNKDTDKVEHKKENTSNKKDTDNKDSDADKADETDEKAQTTAKEPTNQTEVNKAVTAEQAAAVGISALAQGNKTEISATTATDVTKEDSATGVEKAAKEQDFDVDLAKAAKLPKDIDAANSQQNKAKIQPQTQQAIFNIKIASGDGTSTDSAAATAGKTLVIQSDVEAPANPGKQALKDMLEKSALTQDILDKTNAKVTSVTTSGSSGGNLLNQQNAQEQGVKFSLEGVNNLSSATNSATQTTFDKTVENVQQPKELSKTDILAQIHTKLDEFKEEGTTRVTIVLKPESLGKINLELVNGKDGLTARMTTESAQVKELLDKNLGELSSSLGKQGVNVNNVSIKVAETQNSSNGMLNFDQSQQQFQQENQQSSSNTSQHQSESRGLPFEEDFINTATNTEDTTQSVSSHIGQVDYKI